MSGREWGAKRATQIVLRQWVLPGMPEITMRLRRPLTMCLGVDPVMRYPLPLR